MRLQEGGSATLLSSQLTTARTVNRAGHVCPQPKRMDSGVLIPTPPDEKRGTKEGLGTKRGTAVRFLQQLTGA